MITAFDVLDGQGATVNVDYNIMINKNGLFNSRWEREVSQTDCECGSFIVKNRDCSADTDNTYSISVDPSPLNDGVCLEVPYYESLNVAQRSTDIT